ncbi:MAG: YybS family protein [Desulfobacteraceae bacterium]|nr:YybS family protein [Desulfobacteraceae bacterium]
MKLKDLLGCVGWAAFFLLASAWIPLFGPFLSLLAPLPFLYYSTKLGLYQGIKLAVAAMLSVGLFAKLAGYPQVILFGTEFSLLGIALSELMRRRFSLGQTIFLATAFMLILGFCFLVLVALSENAGPFEMISKYLQGHLKETITAYEETGIAKENALEIEAYAKAFLDTISKIYPSLMIVGTGFAVWLNIVLARPLFKRGHLEYPNFVPMDRWQAPDALVWGVIVSGFALFFSSGGIRLVAINVLIVIMAAYLFHGLSIILFFLNKYNVPSWMRIGIYFLIIIQQLFLAVLALAGLFDQWIDFRKIHRRVEG